MRAHIVVTVILLFSGLILQAQQSQTSSSSPLSVSDIEHGLKAGVTNARMAALVKQYGVDFEVSGVEKELKAAGANDDLLTIIGRNQHAGSESDKTDSRPIGGKSQSCNRSWSSKWDHIVNSDFRDRLLRNVDEFSRSCPEIAKLGPKEADLELQYMANPIGKFSLETFYTGDATSYFQGWLQVCECRSGH